MTPLSGVAIRPEQADPIRDRKRSTPKQQRAHRVNDACDVLQISRSHLYTLAAAGKIKLIRIGGRTLVPDAEIDRLVEQGA
jgi:excisionase family DNA binding protein